MAIGQLPSGASVLVVETQMGAPATQIIMKEMLSDELTDTNYQTGSAMTRLPHKVVVRVGTAGGINCKGLSIIRVGDVVNATHSIGVTGSMIQSLTRLDFWRPGAVAEFLNKWTDLGSNFTLTETGHPRVECSEDVVEALDTAGRQVAGDFYHKGGNITKDSLYAELNVETFLDLCRSENCRSTEMELSAIALAASGCDAHFGMISAILGVLPGASFTGSERDKARAESRSISVALEALNRLSIQS
jgi:uridine phosphorylase